jgi:alpha-glucosidase (family GH31 glycosyl hydrolase)
MRPMWMEYPDDVNTFELDKQYLFGESILVVGIDYTFSSITVYLPPEDYWYFMVTKELIKNKDAII